MIFLLNHLPSNLGYLDRESLATLIKALKVFEGGVLPVTSGYKDEGLSESYLGEAIVKSLSL